MIEYEHRKGEREQTRAINKPREKRTQYRISYTYPGRRKTEVPAEFTCISDKYNCRKIRCTVGKRRQPWSYRTAAEDESVDIRCLLLTVNADADGNREKYQQH